MECGIEDNILTLQKCLEYLKTDLKNTQLEAMPKLYNLSKLFVTEKSWIGLALFDTENTYSRMFGELLVYSFFFAPLLVWKLGLHLLAEKTVKKKFKESKEACWNWDLREADHLITSALVLAAKRTGDKSSIERTSDTIVLKVRSLSDVYERCNLVHAEPTNYTKAKLGRQSIVPNNNKARLDISSWIAVTILDLTYQCSFGSSQESAEVYQRATDIGIWYTKIEEVKLNGYTYSDWEGSEQYVGMQKTKAQSTAEVEYISIAAAANQAIWLNKLLTNIGQGQSSPIDLYCDNKFAIAIDENPGTKHINELQTPSFVLRNSNLLVGSGLEPIGLRESWVRGLVDKGKDASPHCTLPKGASKVTEVCVAVATTVVMASLESVDGRFTVVIRVVEWALTVERENLIKRF
uniref:Reverse transcriptase Ty1/copia-type domain-containing protein n=1 Tax=Salix viminalis TaxID=40686 RepID=A0A6N2LIG7_SALVM